MVPETPTPARSRASPPKRPESVASRRSRISCFHAGDFLLRNGRAGHVDGGEEHPPGLESAGVPVRSRHRPQTRAEGAQGVAHVGQERFEPGTDTPVSAPLRRHGRARGGTPRLPSASSSVIAAATVRRSAPPSGPPPHGRARSTAGPGGSCSAVDETRTWLFRPRASRRGSGVAQVPDVFSIDHPTLPARSVRGEEDRARSEGGVRVGSTSGTTEFLNRASGDTNHRRPNDGRGEANPGSAGRQPQDARGADSWRLGGCG
jgi:hypothetical protein